MIYALYTALLEHFYGRLSYILMEIDWCEREKPKYEENSIQPKRKFAQFEPEGFSPRAQIEQIFSEAGWNFLNIAVSPEDTSLFTIYNTN